MKPQRLPAQMVCVDEALGRVTAEEVVARRDLPPFRRSAVDGYAVKAKDIAGATQAKPRILRLVGKGPIQRGEAKEIWTGGPLPQGADSVIMLEYAEKQGKRIGVSAPLALGANVSARGEDARKGDVVAGSGQKLTPYHLGLLAALGVSRVRVVQKPRVALLPTGGELTSATDNSRQHKVVEVNSIILSNLCLQEGAEAYSLGIAGDDEDLIAARVKEGLADADIVITTGGTSVGKHDLVPRAIAKMARDGIVVHGIAMRPGMPTALAIVDGKPVFVFSGNPVAAAVAFEAFAYPLIQRLLGATGPGRARVKATLTRKVAGTLGRRVFLRVRAYEKNGDFYAEPVAVKGSGIITTLTRANGYVVIPEDREGLAAGEVVTVSLWESMGI